MRKWIIRVLAFLLVLASFLSREVRAQKNEGGPLRSALQILVFIRNADNSYAPNGLEVRLEADDGGLMDVKSTDFSGKIVFHPAAPAGYTVVVHGPGYKDASQHVDLTRTPMAAVTVQLIPLPNEDGRSLTRGGAEGASVSAAELAIPEEARKELETGQKLLTEKHDARGSISHLKKAIYLHEDFPKAYMLLGLAYLQEQDFADSKAALDRAIQLDTKSGPSYIALGGCLNQMKDYLGAEKALLKGLEILPDSPDGNYELARTYWALHRWQEAEPHASKAEKIQPRVPGVHVLMGNILLQKQDVASALKEFNEYLRLDPHGTMSDAVRAIVAKLEKNAATHK